MFLTGAVENKIGNYKSDIEKHFPKEFTSTDFSMD